MIQRRAHFEAQEDAIAFLQAKAVERGPPNFWRRFLQVVDAPIRKLSFGFFSLDKRDYSLIEAEQREYPKAATQDILEAALTLAVAGGALLASRNGPTGDVRIARVLRIPLISKNDRRVRGGLHCVRVACSPEPPREWLPEGRGVMGFWHFC